MKRILSLALAAGAISVATPAYAVNYCVGSIDNVALPNSPNCNAAGANQQATNIANAGFFNVVTSPPLFSIFNGVVTATLGHNPILGGNASNPVAGSDTFFFTIPQTGFGQGSLTSVGNLLSAQDLDFVSVILNNGVSSFAATLSNGAVSSTAALADAPIFFGNLNSLTVNYLNRGNGRFSGDLTFVPVPEPTTWAMMLAGFAGLGFAMRRRRRQQPKLRFSY